MLLFGHCGEKFLGALRNLGLSLAPPPPQLSGNPPPPPPIMVNIPQWEVLISWGTIMGKIPNFWVSFLIHVFGRWSSLKNEDKLSINKSDRPGRGSQFSRVPGPPPLWARCSSRDSTRSTCSISQESGHTSHQTGRGHFGHPRCSQLGIAGPAPEIRATTFYLLGPSSASNSSCRSKL